MPAQDAWSGGGIITLAAFDPNGDPVKYFVGAEPEKEDGQRLQVELITFQSCSILANQGLLIFTIARLCMQCSSPLHCLLRKNEPLSSDSHSPHICLYGTVSCAVWWHSMLMPLSQLQCIVINSSFVYRQKVVLGNIAVAAQSCIA